VTRDEIRRAILTELGHIAPEADLNGLDPDADLRYELDIDSLDFLNFVIAIDARLHVDVPELDYSKVTTLRDCTDYVAAKLGVP
jgi:acyl carrier protein